MELSLLLKNKRQTIISIFVIFLLVGTIFTSLQTFKYGSKSRILVIQEGHERVDPFAVSRSVEYLSDLFSRVVYSNSFLNLVLDSDFDVDPSYFTDDSIKQNRIWNRTITAKSIENSGIIVISVYHPDPNQARQIALAVNHILINQNQNYQGLGNSVRISVLDQPTVSRYPLKPNLLLSFFLVVALSLSFALVYIYIFPEEKYDINIFKRNKRNKIRPKDIKPRVNNVTNDINLIDRVEREVVEEDQDSASIKNVFD